MIDLIEKYITDIKFVETNNFILDQFKKCFIFKNIIKIKLIEYNGKDEKITSDVHKLNNSIITNKVSQIVDLSEYPCLKAYQEIPFLSEYLESTPNSIRIYE